MNKYIIPLIALTVIGITEYKLFTLSSENAILKISQKALLDSANHYKVLDNLNAIKIASLSLSLNDYKKYRAEDYEVIKELTKHEKLSSAQSIQPKTTQVITTTVRDTIYCDTVKAFNYKSKYTDVDGLIWSDSVQLIIANREELIITQSLEKKKFLGIRLPIWLFGSKCSNIRVVSKNPNTQIINSEFVNIK